MCAGVTVVAIVVGPIEVEGAKVTNGTQQWSMPKRLVGWLARDDWRGLVTSVAALGPSTLLLVWLDWGPDVPQWLVYLLLYWSVWGVMQVAAIALVLGRGDAETFAARIRGSQPKRRSISRELLDMGDGAVSLGAQLSVVMLGLTLYICVTPSLRTETVAIVLAAVAVVVSWLVTAFSYAVEYARANTLRPGLEFPGSDPPGFSDYLYLAIGMNATFGTTDVSLTHADMRRLATTQTLIAFAFNTVVVALLIALISSSS